MTVRFMRREISKVYNNKTWDNKVAQMPDNQVIAIYFSFLEQGRFERVDPEPVSKQQNHQITMFEYLQSIGGSA